MWLDEGLEKTYQSNKKQKDRKIKKEENSIVYRKWHTKEVSPYISIITINFKALVLVW